MTQFDPLLYKYNCRVSEVKRRAQQEDFSIHTMSSRYSIEPMRIDMIYVVEIEHDDFLRMNNDFNKYDREKALREKNPALKRAYDNYQLLMSMADQNVEVDRDY